jgi:contact-dependent growth inhibition (CDI) system CdiI-like immunity protein
MGWWEWLNLAVIVLLLAMTAAWLLARRYDRREQESARRRREQRLADWRVVEWPQAPQTFPEPGTTRLDQALASELEESDEYEELRQLFGAYFHQDWVIEFDDEDDVVRGYLEGHAHRPEDVVELLHAIDKLLAFGLSDNDLLGALGVLGTDYYPAGATNAWLRSLRAKVLAEATGS